MADQSDEQHQFPPLWDYRADYISEGKVEGLEGGTFVRLKIPSEFQGHYTTLT